MKSEENKNHLNIINQSVEKYLFSPQNRPDQTSDGVY